MYTRKILRIISIRSTCEFLFLDYPSVLFTVAGYFHGSMTTWQSHSWNMVIATHNHVNIVGVLFEFDIQNGSQSSDVLANLLSWPRSYVGISFIDDTEKKETVILWILTFFWYFWVTDGYILCSTNCLRRRIKCIFSARLLRFQATIWLLFNNVIKKSHQLNMMLRGYLNVIAEKFSDQIHRNVYLRYCTGFSFIRTW